MGPGLPFGVIVLTILAASSVASAAELPLDASFTDPAGDAGPLFASGADLLRLTFSTRLGHFAVHLETEIPDGPPAGHYSINFTANGVRAAFWGERTSGDAVEAFYWDEWRGARPAEAEVRDGERRNITWRTLGVGRLNPGEPVVLSEIHATAVAWDARRGPLAPFWRDTLTANETATIAPVLRADAGAVIPAGGALAALGAVALAGIGRRGF